MNIICNNCVGARMYECAHKQFPNPFMWNAINAYDFIKLINEFDTIDLNKPNIELEQYLNQDKQSVLITLDNDVKLHFIHYMLDKTKDVLIKEKNTNILYKDILKYATDKWFNRLKRLNEEPTFMFSFNYMKTTNDVYEDVLYKLLNITNKQIIIICHDCVDIQQNYSGNIRVIRLDSQTMSLDTGLSKILINNYINL